MKVGSFYLLVTMLFFLITTVVYWIVAEEIIGTVALGVTGGMTGMIGFYLLLNARRSTNLPEDNPNANVEDADPDYGFFSPHSWWPFVTAFGVGLICIGFAIAVWIVILGVITLLGGTTGFLFEYYRGEFAD